MDFRQLRYLLEIVNQGGFTKASETLGIAQSALSVTVKNLEEEIGVTLIDRHYRRLTLTTEGEIFVARAEALQEQMNALHHEMEELKGLAQGTIKVGLPGMLATHFFPDKILQFRKKYPNLRVSVFSDGAQKLTEMLSCGQLDIAVLGKDNLPATLTWEPIIEDEIVACVASSHPLAGRSRISIQELAQEKLFLFQEGNYQRAVITDAIERTGQKPRIVFETNLASLLIKMTAKGEGVCTLLKMASEAGELVSIPLHPTIKITAGVSWRTDSYLPLAAKAFIDFLMNESDHR